MPNEQIVLIIIIVLFEFVFTFIISATISRISRGAIQYFVVRSITQELVEVI